MAMTYVYLIESVYHQGHTYVRLADDLKQRFAHHNEESDTSKAAQGKLS
jgi:predicted GIY-YIG superfamily endonuclease